MNKLNQISEIENVVLNANSVNPDGRQVIANKCKEFYNLIEEDVFNAGTEWMLKGLYNDLCSGNFAEPFMCEKKKETFSTCLKIYQDRILPNL